MPTMVSSVGPHCMGGARQVTPRASWSPPAVLAGKPPVASVGLVQDGEVRRAFQRSLQKQGLKFKLSTKVCKAAAPIPLLSLFVCAKRLRVVRCRR